MKQIKLKNRIFVNGFTQALSRLADQPMSLLHGFRLAKFIKQVSKQEELFLEQKNKLVRKYGVEDSEKKGSYTFSPENQDELNKDWEELMAIEESYKIEPVELKADATMTTKDIMMLEDIIKN